MYNFASSVLFLRVFCVWFCDSASGPLLPKPCSSTHFVDDANFSNFCSLRLDDVAALARAFLHRRVRGVHNFHSFDLHFQQADGDNDGSSLGSLLSDSSKTLNINTGFRC